MQHPTMVSSGGTVPMNSSNRDLRQCCRHSYPGCSVPDSSSCVRAEGPLHQSSWFHLVNLRTRDEHLHLNGYTANGSRCAEKVEDYDTIPYAMTRVVTRACLNEVPGLAADDGRVVRQRRAPQHLAEHRARRLVVRARCS